MSKWRFSISAMMVLVGFAALGITAVKSHDLIWQRVLLGFDAGWLVLSLILAKIFGRPFGVFFTGVFAFGLVYFLLVYPSLWSPMSRVYDLDEGEDMLPTSAWFRHVAEILEPTPELKTTPTSATEFRAIRNRRAEVRARVKTMHLLAVPLIGLIGGAFALGLDQWIKRMPQGQRTI